MKTIKTHIAYRSNDEIYADEILITISDELRASINKAITLVIENDFVKSVTIVCEKAQIIEYTGINEYKTKVSDFEVSTELLLVNKYGFTYRAFGKYDSADYIESEFVNIKTLS